MSKNELIENAIQNFRVLADMAQQITSGNLSHNSKYIEGRAKRCYEFLEKHKDDEINDRKT